ncbi:toll-like receptor 4 [Dreissena polymorpha]|uniref:TIR domain-containing protein n=1 Tax=Dreissena polymorpha TaxID=45954 RepID=A0A9D4NEU1_DREPO|nr:toll-like receptor 4 [Dreissena polymorpha]KAH3893095.1 hypothetical protein DPMN_017238 [Dreissena polymorpha]
MLTSDILTYLVYTYLRVAFANDIFEKCNSTRPFNSTIGTCLRQSTVAQCLNDNYTTYEDDKRCQNNGYIKCSNLGLPCIPDKYILERFFLDEKACGLDLSQNLIDALPDYAFKDTSNLSFVYISGLYLNENRLRWISSHTFDGLSHLKYLNLTENCLEWKDSFQTGMFMPLEAIEVINFKRNKFFDFIELDNEFHYMTNLSKLYINPYNATGNFTLGPGFRKLTKLTRINFAGISPNDCSVNTITQSVFENTLNVLELSLRECNIIDIDEQALLPLNNTVAELDLSYNRKLSFTGMNKALKGLRYSQALKTLRANMIYSNLELGIEFKEEHLENIKTLQNIETLNIDLNKIEIFNKKVFEPESQWPTSLRELTLAGNRLTAGEYMKCVFMAENITHLDISRQHLDYDPFANYGRMDKSTSLYNRHNKMHTNISNHEFLKLNLNTIDWWSVFKTSPTTFSFTCECDNMLSEKVMCLPKQINTIKWRKSFIYSAIPPAVVCGASRLKHLDMSFNLFHTWQGPVLGLGNLEFLDLSENYCKNLTTDFFLGFPNLLELNISGNMLGQSFNPLKNNVSHKLFANLQNIRTIDMSSLKIVDLSQSLFQNMTYLEKLNLSNNYITTWTTDLRSPCLYHLDVSGNKLSTLPENLTTYLENLTRSPCNKGRNVTLVLGNNPLVCSCEQLPFWKWLNVAKVQVYGKSTDFCMLNGKRYYLSSVANYSRVLDTLSDNCRDRYWVSWVIGGVSVMFGILMTICVTIALYKNRWKLRYMYYNRKRRHTHQGFECLFSNDAMVSYAKDRASFIKKKVVPALENIHQLKLWVADRDSMPGASVAENIVHAIYTSRKTVLLVDEKYLNSSWCVYDLNMARLESVESNRNLIIVVMMERIPVMKLPLNIMRMLRNEIVLEYPENEQYIDAFWTNLALEIKK